MRRISKDDIIRLKKKDALLVDMRSPIEYRDTKLAGTVNLPLRNFTNTMLREDKKKPIVIFGADDDISAAIRIAEQWGRSNVYATNYKSVEDAIR